MTSHHHVPEVHCPRCDAPLDHATGAGHDRAPKGGAVSVCVMCSCAMVFNDDLTVRQMPVDMINSFTPGAVFNLLQAMLLVQNIPKHLRQKK